MAVPLSEGDIGMCLQAFAQFDLDGSGAISAHKLRQALASMGQDLSVEEIFDMVALVDSDGSGVIEFPAFLKVIEMQRQKTAQREDQNDAIDAFVALGGKEDLSGRISIARLITVVNEFGLTIDIEKLTKDTDDMADRSGTVDFRGFKKMLSDAIENEDED